MLTPPEVVVITFRITKYGKKVSLKPTLKILVEGCDEITGRQ
jgi:hypothetical protein